MYTQEDLYWVWLCGQEGIGAAKRKALLERCGDIVKVYEAQQEQYVEAGLNEQQAERLALNKDLEGWRRKCQEWNRQGIEVVSRGNPLYPERLSNVQPAADLLFLRGNPQFLQTSCVAIVGARKCSTYGSSAARYLGHHLAEFGYTIVSGMASGIDAYAHWGALEEQGKTIAVLGCGIDICYPKENIQLYERIASQGLLISEYAPGTPPRPGFFPMRNRIIAALSRGVIVAEAAERSGALITVDQALEAGVEVFAVPGRIFDGTSKGTNRLIKQGASILYDWQDVPMELGDQVPEKEMAVKRFQDADTQRIWENIGWDARDPQALARELNIEAGKFLQCITMLELSGYIQRNLDGSIAIKKETE